MIIIGGRFLQTDELRNGGLKLCGENVTVHETCQLVGAENIEIGNNVRIDPYCIISAASGSVRLGSNIHLGARCYLAGTGGIELHDFSGLSQEVRIYSISDDFLGGGLTNPTIPKKFLNVRVGKVTLGRHVVVGSGSVIFPGVHVGDGAVVGTMSVVKHSLDPWGIYAGIPARKIKNRRRDVIERYEQEFLSEQDYLSEHA